MSKNIRVLFTRFTMVSAHLSIIPEFLEKISLLGFENIFSVNMMMMMMRVTMPMMVMMLMFMMTFDDGCEDRVGGD